MDRPRFKLSAPAALAAVFAGQCALLAYMIGDQIAFLKSGREIVLDVEPVDPRSLFRGDYVTLSYPVARVPRDGIEGAGMSGHGVYVVLRQDASGAWQQVRVLASRPVALGVGEVALRGRLEGSPSDDRRARFGIESYFVPEGTGKTIEDAAGRKQVSVRVAVGTDGRTAIKGLLIDGKPVHDEPLL